jgi:hypothetical protein
MVTGVYLGDTMKLWQMTPETCMKVTEIRGKGTQKMGGSGAASLVDKRVGSVKRGGYEKRSD